MMGLVLLQEETQESLRGLSLPFENKARRQQSISQEEGAHQNSTMLIP